MVLGGAREKEKGASRKESGKKKKKAGGLRCSGAADVQRDGKDSVLYVLSVHNFK